MTVKFKDFCQQCNGERVMSGQVTDEDFVTCSCAAGHSMIVYPKDGKYSLLYNSAILAFQKNNLYEAASSGYAALETFMKSYILASSWDKAGRPVSEKMIELEKAELRNKMLFGNSQHIIGAYAYLVFENSKKQVNINKFGELARVRNDIIHGSKIPSEQDVDKLLIGVRKFILDGVYGWFDDTKMAIVTQYTELSAIVHTWNDPNFLKIKQDVAGSKPKDPNQPDIEAYKKVWPGQNASMALPTNYLAGIDVKSIASETSVTQLYKYLFTFE